MTDSLAGNTTRPPAAPQSVSEDAAAFLNYMATMPQAPLPLPDTAEQWLEVIATMNDNIRAQFAPRLPAESALERENLTIGGVPTTVLWPAGVQRDGKSPLFLEIHGGGLFLGGGDLAWMMAAPAAQRRDGVTWSPDYRMPPLHPFPAALDDVVAVYRAALEVRAPEQIIVSGGSAGGNLAAALLLRAKDEGLPMPAGLVLLTPEVDLTESGDSFVTNAGVDPVLSSLANVNAMYAADADLAHPYLSPLFGDLEGFPRTLLQTGTRDLFLSNTVRMHRALLRAGASAELHVFEAMPHGAFSGSAPEDIELEALVRDFERACLARPASPLPHLDGRI